MCLISDQKCAADLFLLLHLRFGTLLNIFVPPIPYLLSEVHSRPSYIKSHFHHPVQGRNLQPQLPSQTANIQMKHQVKFV